MANQILNSGFVTTLSALPDRVIGQLSEKPSKKADSVTNLDGITNESLVVQDRPRDVIRLSQSIEQAGPRPTINLFAGLEQIRKKITDSDWDFLKSLKYLIAEQYNEKIVAYGIVPKKLFEANKLKDTIARLESLANNPHITDFIREKTGLDVGLVTFLPEDKNLGNLFEPYAACEGEGLKYVQLGADALRAEPLSRDDSNINLTNLLRYGDFRRLVRRCDGKNLFVLTSSPTTRGLFEDEVDILAKRLNGGFIHEKGTLEPKEINGRRHEGRYRHGMPLSEYIAPTTYPVGVSHAKQFEYHQGDDDFERNPQYVRPTCDKQEDYHVNQVMFRAPKEVVGNKATRTIPTEV